MELSTLFNQDFDEHTKVLAATRKVLAEPYQNLVNICVKSIRQGGKIMFFGNGGSAADSQHLATELTVRYSKNRLPIASIALSTDTSAITACANDLSYEDIFSRQIAALGKQGDVSIGISTSGSSENVIRALETSKKMNITPAAFGGKNGGKMVDLANPYLIVPSNTTARIQEMHILIGHLLCDGLERKLGLV
jgi:D-sedoheptulose 7-phosphate isomerase